MLEMDTADVSMGRMHLVSGECGREEDGVGRWHHRSRVGPWGSGLHGDTGHARLLSSPNCSIIQYLGQERRGLEAGKCLWVLAGWASPVLQVFVSQHGEGCGRQRAHSACGGRYLVPQPSRPLALLPSVMH